MSRVTHLLIHGITLERKAPVDQGHGRFVDTYTALADIRARVMGLNGSDILLAQQLQVRAIAVAYFEPDADVRLDDAFTHQGHRYRVTALAPPSVAHHLKAFCEDVQTGRAA